MKFPLLIALGLFVTTALSAADKDEIVTPDQLQTILGAAREWGAARLDTGSYDYPVIEGTVGGLTYDIYFQNCDGDISTCHELLFSASFTGYNFTIENANRWNAETLLPKVYLDTDGEPVAEYFVTLRGGVTSANLADIFDWWRLRLSSFEEFLKERSSENDGDTE